MARSGQRATDLRARRAYRPPITTRLPDPNALPFASVEGATFEFVSDEDVRLSAEISLSGACPFVSLREYRFDWEPNGSGLSSTFLSEFTEYVLRQDTLAAPVSISTRHELTLEEGRRLADWLRDANEKAAEEFSRRLNVSQMNEAGFVLYELQQPGFPIWVGKREWGSDKLTALGILDRNELQEAMAPSKVPFEQKQLVLAGKKVDWSVANQIHNWIEDRDIEASLPLFGN